MMIGDPIGLDGWSKADGKLRLNGHNDVSVSLTGPNDAPFTATVGQYTRYCAYLSDALSYAQQLALGRAIITGPDPIPNSLQADADFLASKGLG